MADLEKDMKVIDQRSDLAVPQLLIAYNFKTQAAYIQILNRDTIVNEDKIMDIYNTLNKYDSVSHYNNTLYINHATLKDFLEHGINELQIVTKDITYINDMDDINIITDPEVNFEITNKGTILKLTSEFTDQELLEISENNMLNKIYRISTEKFIDLSSPIMYNLQFVLKGLNMSNIFNIENSEITIPPSKIMYIVSLLSDANFTLTKDEFTIELFNEYNSIYEVNTKLLPDIIFNLNDSQITKYNYLRFMNKYKFGAILASENKLNKILSTITLLNTITTTKKHIIVCNESLIAEWKLVIKKFCPNLSTHIYNEDKETRFISLNDNYDIILITYDLLRKDIDDIEMVDFFYTILDDAEIINIHTTKNAKSVKKINSEHRLCLTGADVKNNLTQLWSIYDFLMPSYLINKRKFNSYYEQNINKLGLEVPLIYLEKQISPFINLN